MMNNKYYFYDYKHERHSVCLMNTSPVEYLGVKATADSKEEAENICFNLNFEIQTENLNN